MKITLIDTTTITPSELTQKIADSQYAIYTLDQDNYEVVEDYKRKETFKKRIFAGVVKQMEAKSNVERERMARTSDEWIEWLSEYVVLEFRYSKYKIERDNLQRYWETCRTLLTQKRQELQYLNEG